MDIFCIGMPRSASTWQYAVTCALVERHRGGKRMGYFHTADQVSDYVARRPPGAEGWRVFKSHAPPSEWLAGQLAAGEAAAIYSYRDLRDVAFSLAHKLSGTFEQIVEQQRALDETIAADMFWQGRAGVACQRYEAITNEPAEAIEEIAAHLGIELAPGEAEELAREQSLEANKARTKKLADDLRAEGLDPTHPAHAFANIEEDLYHWNHIRAGKAGGWRSEATPRQLAVLAVTCGPWLVARGYEPDNAWAEPALSYLAEVAGREPATPGQAATIPWEVHYARMEIQAAFHRQKCLMDDAVAQGSDPGPLATLESTFRAQLRGLRDAMQDKARELESAQQAASHFRMCHDALCEERDFLRGQFAAKDEEAKFFRRQFAAKDEEVRFLRDQLSQGLGDSPPPWKRLFRSALGRGIRGPLSRLVRGSGRDRG